jgi:hypothetical protein
MVLQACTKVERTRYEAESNTWTLMDADGTPVLEVYAQDLPGSLSYDKAVAACAALNLTKNASPRAQNQAAWRLPTRDELNTVRVLLGKNREASFEKKWYWSNSPNDSATFWGVHFGNKLEYYNFRIDVGQVRPVRSVQSTSSRSNPSSRSNASSRSNPSSQTPN